MEQTQDRTEARKRYDDARAWLSILIDNPDKTVSVDEYKALLKDARSAVAKTHAALMEGLTA